MKQRLILFGLTMVALWFALACARSARAMLIFEVPNGYTGPVEVQLGVSGAPPLQKQGANYVISVPSTGRVSTSTTLSEAAPSFKNVTGDRVWGYETLILRTGDGIPVGGNIEFFVGTKEQYQVELTRRHKSSILEWTDEFSLESMGVLLPVYFLG